MKLQICPILTICLIKCPKDNKLGLLYWNFQKFLSSSNWAGICAVLTGKAVTIGEVNKLFR